ncbi:MAG: hypothetical protein F6J93_20230 [Oscillatoria sp. SIO1A7]|nr:hypothetical protein [Oscillatoria sp. SIO1A7]
MPNAIHPQPPPKRRRLPNAQCPMPNAPCPIPEKISIFTSSHSAKEAL